MTTERPRQWKATSVVLLAVAFAFSFALSFADDSPDLTGLKKEFRQFDANKKVTLACPGLYENTVVTSVQWVFQYESLIEYSHQTEVIWNPKDRVTILTGELYALFFNPILASDGGRYYCLINDRRRPDGVIDIIVCDVPEAPPVPQVQGYTSRTANLSWAPPFSDNHSPISHYVIQIRTPNTEWKDNHTTTSNRTNYVVGGLKPYSLYSFRVIAVNAYGRSIPSAETIDIKTSHEAPVGVVIINSITSKSANSVVVNWTPPSQSSVNGEFMNYRLTYRRRLFPNEGTQELLIRNINTSSCTIHDLLTYTQYLVSIQVVNDLTGGPLTNVTVMTHEGEPSPPVNVTIFFATSTELHLRWSKPEFENGEIVGYRIYYAHVPTNHTDVQSSNSTLPTFVLINLKPFTDYKVWVKAFTLKHEGYPSDPASHRTDVAGPGMPILVKASCQLNTSLFVEWLRPSTFNVSIDEYYVVYGPRGTEECEEIAINPRAFRRNHPLNVLITDLTVDTHYEVYVVGITNSIYQQGLLIRGDPSEKRVVYIDAECKPAVGSVWEFELFSETMLVIVASVTVGIILMCCIVFCLCKRRSRNQFHPAPEEPQHHEEDFEEAPETPGPIRVEQFPLHVAKLHTDGAIGFSRQFSGVDNTTLETGLTSVASQLPENHLYNRYKNVPAYDHSRVKFVPQSDEEEEKDIYINANFIDGFEKKGAYIGTQGPLPSTVFAFWRMIWEQKARTIVMITNLIERSRRKCDMYWPSDGSQMYGDIKVTLEKEDVNANYTVRSFRIQLIKASEQWNMFLERFVVQFHYTNWPDHGTPDHALPILRFINKSSSSNPIDAGPIVVHCSAGIGRTGAYIVLDTMLKMIRFKKEVDVCNFLLHIRTQRNFLVQTEEQYIFIHDALVEAIESGDTYIHQGYLKSYVSRLLGSRRKGVLLYEEQFKLVTNFKTLDYHFLAAKHPVNILKNGGNRLLPMEASRVRLLPKPGREGSDYVNASWFMGYKHLREFIVAGTPCDCNLFDFWQMMWDHNVRTVAMFIDFEQADLEPFWPVGKEAIIGETFQIKMKFEGQDDVTFRDFSLSHPSGEIAWYLRVFFYSTWPKCAEPIITVFDAVKNVRTWNAQHGNMPIALIDRFGSSKAATFCALASLTSQLESEGFVDVYTFVKLYHMCRPGCWDGPDDLLFIYEAMLAFSETMPFTSVPMVPPQYEGLGPTEYHQVNGNAHPVSYMRSHSPSSIEDMAAPEMKSMCHNGGPLVPPNVCTLQENYMNEMAVCEETKLTIELLQDLAEEDEELESDEIEDEV